MNLNHWQRLGLPAALGICAGFLNWVTVSSKLEPRGYVGTKQNLLPGQAIRLEEHLKEIEFSHSPESNLEQTLIPWSKAYLLENRIVQRDMSAGSLLTQYDLATEVCIKASTKKGSSFSVGDLVNVHKLGEKNSVDKSPFLFACRVLSQNGSEYRLSLDPSMRAKLPDNYSEMTYYLKAMAPTGMETNNK